MSSPDLISDRDRNGLLNRSEPGAGPDFREEPLPRPTRLSKPLKSARSCRQLQNIRLSSAAANPLSGSQY
jgi:hypothetical protein